MFISFHFHKCGKSDQDGGKKAECPSARPAKGSAEVDEYIQCDHGHDENGKACKVEMEGFVGISFAFRRRPEEYHAKGSENDGKNEDASPAEAGCNGAAREGCDAAASPGADRPEAQGSLAGFPFEIGIHEGNGRRHDACGRQTLNDAARDEEHRALRKDEAGRADDA